MEKLTQKCEDLEGRHNIGVPEGKEGPNPRDFIGQLLQEVLNLEETDRLADPPATARVP